MITVPFTPHQLSALPPLMSGLCVFILWLSASVCGLHDMDFDEPGELALFSPFQGAVGMSFRPNVR